MTLVELENHLKSLEMPVAYNNFKTGVNLPFLIYKEKSKAFLRADDNNFYEYKNIQVELYTDKKDFIIESKLETLLNNLEIEFDVSEIYIDSEKLFQRVYTITI